MTHAATPAPTPAVDITLAYNTDASDLSGALPPSSQGALAVADNATISTLAPSNKVPEPDQWVLLLAGLGAVGWVARRRR